MATKRPLYDKMPESVKKLREQAAAHARDNPTATATTVRPYNDLIWKENVY